MGWAAFSNCFAALVRAAHPTAPKNLMNRKTQQIWLAEADGEVRRWTLKFAPVPDGCWAETRFEKREIVVSSKARTKKQIRGALIHEATHIAGGQVTSEEYAINTERNAMDLLGAVGV